MSHLVRVKPIPPNVKPSRSETYPSQCQVSDVMRRINHFQSPCFSGLVPGLANSGAAMLSMLAAFGAELAPMFF
jgi:hypothetical protein